MDEELADLILALWLQNSEDNSRTGGLGVGDDSNLELAIRLQQEVYDQAEPQIGDRHIVQSDGQTSSEDPLEEDASVEQGWVRGRGVTYPQSQQHQCMSYQEIKAVIELPCGHLHCRDCIRHVFTNVAIDGVLFPPRCCGEPVPASIVRHILNSDLTTLFERSAHEYGTRNRTYCHDTSCATSIGPCSIRGSTGTCSRLGCGKRTCVLCKKEAHTGECTQTRRSKTW